MDIKEIIDLLMSGKKVFVEIMSQNSSDVRDLDYALRSLKPAIKLIGGINQTTLTENRIKVNTILVVVDPNSSLRSRLEEVLQKESFSITTSAI